MSNAIQELMELVLATGTEAEISQLKRLDVYKVHMADKARELAQEDIEFSNATHFLLSTGETVSLAQLALFTVAIKLTKKEQAENKACNTLGVALPSTASDNQKKVSEAWSILKRVQSGKKAQGEEFPLNIEGRNALLGL